MQVNLAKSAGFCLGVKRAIRIGLDAAHQYRGIVMLADIVHNEEVVRQIKKAGIKKIISLDKTAGKLLLISAHGAARKTYAQAGKKGMAVIDATCPMVKGIHRLARDMDDKGFRVIVIGDKKHDEVIGIAGQLKQKAIVIEGLKDIRSGKFSGVKKAAVVIQSTQNLERARKIFRSLKKHIPTVKFFNTICQPTRIKQQEIKSLPAQNDCMFIIGSKKSANTKRLFEISKAQNRRSYWINSYKEIKPEWLKGCRSAGVAAGASTPESSIRKVVAFLRNYSD